jgi:dihydroorotate dehydrogenase
LQTPANEFFLSMYSFLRRLLFWFPAEPVHYFSMNCLQLICAIPWFRKILSGQLAAGRGHAVETFGLHFKNPVVLAAGFDKNARWLRELQTLGFAAVEIGTVTPKPQEGNSKPRLFRLPKDKALINRMGFNNDGVKVVAERLRRWKKTGESDIADGDRMIIGGNIGKNKLTPNENAWKDYETCFRALFNVVDYFVVNVSSPNTPGLRALQEKDALQKILGHLQTINQQQSQPKPLLLKIAPDLTVEQLDDVISLAIDLQLSGLVATNTTIGRNHLVTGDAELKMIGEGGLSGAPLRERSTEILRYIHQRSEGKLQVMASGGIFTARDAAEKLQQGATLVQVYTGFIYEGAAITKKICAAL